MAGYGNGWLRLTICLGEILDGDGIVFGGIQLNWGLGLEFTRHFVTISARIRCCSENK